MSPTPVVVAWSGGKDSTLALSRIRANPELQVCALITSVTRGYDRISIHGVRRKLLEAQAAALGVPLVIAWLDPASSNEQYEAAWAAALQSTRTQMGPVQDIVYGDLFLDDVRAYREAHCAQIGWRPHFPLWGEDTSQLARTFVTAGFSAVITCVDTTQLDGAFAGQAYDATLLDALPYDVDPCGEHGEFHTFVTNGPLFRAPIPVTVGERVLRDNRFQYADLLPAGSPPHPLLDMPPRA